MDRGYNDCSLFGKWTDRAMGFVTRLKEGAAYEVLHAQRGPRPKIILADELIRFTGTRRPQTARTPCGGWWVGMRTSSARSSC